MNLDHLYTILRDTTCQLRKGPMVSSEKQGNVEVTTIDAMPPADDPTAAGLEKVDCVLVVIGVDKAKAQERKAELIEILKTYPQPDRLAGGPSYIEVGGQLGDQGAAFQLFALGEVLGLWKVITPASLGFTGDEATEMAGLGYVMISGWKAPA